MEIEFPEDIEIHIDNNCEVSYPKYVSHLSENETILAKQSENRDNLIISAGTDPIDKQILLCTASGKVLIFDSKKYHIPDGPCHPIKLGSEVFFPNINGRWPTPTPGFAVNSSWIISKSTSALAGAKLNTNYRGENTPK